MPRISGSYKPSGKATSLFGRKVEVLDDLCEDSGLIITPLNRHKDVGIVVEAHQDVVVLHDIAVRYDFAVLKIVRWFETVKHCPCCDYILEFLVDVLFLLHEVVVELFVIKGEAKLLVFELFRFDHRIFK